MFLMDGTAEGSIKCSLTNWTGVVYKIPRDKLSEFRDRDDLKHSGVYFLYGEEGGQPVVYVGQAASRKNGEGILLRLNEHDKGKKGAAYWTEAVAITTTNNRLGATQISYLENYFYRRAKEAGRYEVKNQTEPAAGSSTEEEESELDEFIEYSELIIETLGYKSFVAPRDSSPVSGRPVSKSSHVCGVGTQAESPLMYISRKTREHGQAAGRGRLLSDGSTFVVYKGSTVVPYYAGEKGMSPQVSQRRSALRGAVLDKDETFTSPSAAGSFVVGNSCNGWCEWRDEQGRTLDEVTGRSKK